MIEERAGHHDDSPGDCHPSAECQVERHAPVLHEVPVLVHPDFSLLQVLELVRGQEALGDLALDLGDVHHEEVSAFALEGLDWEVELGKLFEEHVSNVLELLAYALFVAEPVLVSRL